MQRKDFGTVGDTWITDLTHFLDEEGRIAPTKGPVRRLAEFFDSIVVMGSHPEPIAPSKYMVRCRRRPGRKPVLASSKPTLTLLLRTSYGGVLSVGTTDTSRIGKAPSGTSPIRASCSNNPLCRRTDGGKGEAFWWLRMQNLSDKRIQTHRSQFRKCLPMKVLGLRTSMPR
jgi:hypothetical protein